MNKKTNERENGPETTNAPYGWLVTVKATGEAGRVPFNPEKCHEQLQSAVAGDIELVDLYFNLKRVDCFCNDEGKINGLPVNKVISILYGRDLICGDVVICKHDDMGDTQGLTEEESSGVLATLEAAGSVIAAE